MEGAKTPARVLAWILAAGLSLLAIGTSGFGDIPPTFHRGAIVCAAAVIVILLNPLAHGVAPSAGALRALLWLFDVALCALIVTAIVKLFELEAELWGGIYEFTAYDYALGIGGMAVVLEATRRAFGTPLFVLALLALLYCLFGSYLPDFVARSFELEEVIRTMWYSSDGVFGLPTGVGATIVFVYIVFGAMLEGIGAGTVLLKLSTAMTGGLRGGPAHAAVFASSLFGTMNGSAVANVVGTGVFTIPMIRERGFSPRFAGAVEAAASTGGQIMPPVMGAAAFLLAELTATPYILLCVAALVPAALYYFSLFAAVAVEAGRKGIQPVPKARRERMTADDWLRSSMFFVPLLVIVGVLVAGRSPSMAGFWAVVSGVAVALAVNPDLRRRPMGIVEGLVRGGLAGARIVAAVAAIGILVAMMNMSHLGAELARVIETLGEGSLFISLFLTMLAALVLGMGLPTLPAYLIIVLIMGPALRNLGVEIVIAHLFVLYFGVLSAITPPVALAAYAAAPIAGARPMETGVIAVRVALIGFVIPYMFVYNPSLVIITGFETVPFVWAVARIALAVWLFTTGFSGFERMRLPPWESALRIFVGVAALWPSPVVQTAGFAAGALLVAAHRIRARAALADPA